MNPLIEAKNLETSPERLTELALLEVEVTRVVAKNVNTPPETLAGFLVHTDRLVRKNTACNPNTPTEQLAVLAREFAYDVLENPILPLLLMTNAGFLNELPSASLKAMLKRPEAPPEFLEWAAENGSEFQLEALLLNPNMTLSALQRLEQRFPNWAERIQVHVAYQGQPEISQIWNQQRLISEISKNNGTFKKAFANSARTREETWYLLPLALLSIESQKEIALNLDTSIQILLHLAQSKSLELQVCLIQNPFTPKATVQILQEKLLKSEPRMLVRYTDIPLTFLRQLTEHPNYSIRCDVLENRNATPELRKQINFGFEKTLKAGEFSQSTTIALSRYLSLDVMRLLCSSADSQVRQYLADKDNLPEEIIGLLLQDENEWVRCKLRKPAFSFEQLYEEINTSLINANSEFVREDVAKSTALPETMSLFVQDSSEQVRKRLLENPDIAKAALTPEMLESLLASDCSFQRAIAAINLNTSPIQLRKLVGDSALVVRESVARNPKTSEDVYHKLISGFSNESALVLQSRLASDPLTSVARLKQLAQHPDAYVRMNVAANRSSPVDLLELLMKDKTVSVRKSIIGNTNFPILLLREFVQDSNELVRINLAHKPDLPLDLIELLLQDPANEVRFRIMYQENLPQNLINQMHNDPEKNVRAKVAERTDDSFILEKLSQDTDSYVRYHVAQNPKTTMDTLRRLGFDPNQDIRGYALRHPNAPQDIDPVGSDSMLQSQLVQLVISKKEYSAVVALLHPLCPVENLAKFVRHNDPLARIAIALNPNTPARTLKTLLTDGDARVQATARARLMQETSTNPIQEAQNPNTKPERLSALATQNLELKGLVAANPSATTQTLQMLALNPNPQIQQGLVENISYLRHINNASLNKLLKNPETPETQLLWAVRHGNSKHAKAILENPNASQEVLKRLSIRFPEFQELASNHISNANDSENQKWSLQQVLEFLTDRGSSQSSQLWSLGKLTGLSADFFTHERCKYIVCMCIWDSWLGEMHFGSELAKNLFLPMACYEVLAQHEDKNIHQNLARNPSLPVHLIEAFCADKAVYARAAVAANPKTPMKKLIDWIEDTKTDYRITLSAVMNEQFLLSDRLEGIDELLKHNEKEIDLFVASYDQTPSHVLEILYQRYESKLDHSNVQALATANPNASASILSQYFVKQEPGWNVISVLAHPNIPFEYLERYYKHGSDHYIIPLARNPKLPEYMIEHIVTSDNPLGRASLASNPCLSGQWLAVLATQSNSRIRAAVAKNPNTPVAVLQALSLESEKTTLNGLAKNSNTPISILEQLAKQGLAGALLNPKITEAMILDYSLFWLDQLAAVKDNLSVVLAFLHPNCPEALVQKMAKHKEPVFRVVMALHPNATPKVLQLLTQDSDARVRATALARVKATL